MSTDWDIAGFEKRPIARIIADKASNRRIVEICFTALGREHSERVVRRARQKFPGGENSPQFQAEYGLSLTAQPGQTILKGWGDHCIGTVRPAPSKYPQIGALDFGFTHPTCLLLSQVTPYQIQFYGEHYAAKLPVSAHKARAKALLASFLEWNDFIERAGRAPAEAVIRRQIIAETAKGAGWDRMPPEAGARRVNPFTLFAAIVGDVSGAGYKAEYADDPDPINIQPPADEDYRNRDANEALLSGLMRIAARCCYRVWPESSNCEECGAKPRPCPGILIDHSCVNLIREIPLQVLDDAGKRVTVDDHAVDAALYTARYAATMLPRGRDEPPPSPPRRGANYGWREGRREPVGPYDADAVLAEFFR